MLCFSRVGYFSWHYLVFFALLFSVTGLDTSLLASTSASQQSALSECRAFYQSLSDEPMQEAIDPDAVEVGRLKVCGASPSCGSCQEMRPGDCGYVFPSNVLVYPKTKNGAEEICACTVFACSLPWDPAGWNKKCMEELGCYKKPLYRGIGEFPAALCSGYSGDYVKFGPMAFALQSYSKPGVVVYEYKKHKFVRKSYVFPRKISNEYLRQNVQATSGGSASATNSDEKARVWMPAKLVDGTNQHSLNGEYINYFAYRRNDSLCIRNYGKNAVSREEAYVESCVPIPGLDLPVLYAIPMNSFDAILHLRRRYSNDRYQQAQDLSAQILRKVEKRRSVEEKKRLSEATNEINALRRKVEVSTSYALRTGVRMEYDKTDCFKDDELVERAVIAPCDVEYNCEEAQKAKGCFFVMAKGEDVKNSAVNSGIKAFKGFPSRGLLKRESKRPYNGVIDFENYAGICRFAAKHQEEVVLGKKLRVDRAKEPEAEQGCGYLASRVASEMGLGKALYHQGFVACAEKNIIGAFREFEILHKTKCERHSGEINYDTDELCTDRVRVKKKPKKLRRYIVVRSGDVQKRIRCGDKYDIDLRTIGQNVLDKAEINGNRFKFSSEYLSGMSFAMAGSDPCVNPEYDIVYFYEDGGFITDVDLKKCSNPVEEHYAPGKSISGCEYDYVRTDNYEPYLASVPGRVGNASIVPLSVYEQGLCVDNFRSTWFVPAYKQLGEGELKQPGDLTQPYKTEEFCKWDYGCEVGTGGNMESTSSSQDSRFVVRTVYRYPVVELMMPQELAESADDADFLFGKNLGCSLYKVEMWGGGQAAVVDKISNRRRSGRPGQYVMLVLNFKELLKKHSPPLLREMKPSQSQFGGSGASQTNCAGCKYSLVMKIGEGGSTKPGSEKGGDTILQLCVDGNASGGAQVAGRAATSYSEECYEVAKAVGGGGGALGIPPKFTDFVVYYRTITGDVLSDDAGARSLLESHSAMFTKFSMTMNVRASKRGAFAQQDFRERVKNILSNRGYFDGRSLPSEFCLHKSKRSENLDVLIPGMGGCWSKPKPNSTVTSDNEEPKPGVGENGAVMITCERWKDVTTSGETFSPGRQS